MCVGGERVGGYELAAFFFFFAAFCLWIYLIWMGITWWSHGAYLGILI